MEWDATLVAIAMPTAVESEPPKEVPPEEPPAPFDWMPVDPPLRGRALPPASADLARETNSGDWVAVRRIPKDLPQQLRRELIAAARATAADPHPGLLNVRAVSDTEIISDWPPAVSAAALLTRHQGSLPLDVVLAWLPNVASPVDHACAHGFARLGLDPSRWLISFESLADSETPEARGAKPTASWGAHFTGLDPLADFDPLLDAAAGTGATIRVERATRFDALPEYLAALAKAVHELLGGRDRERLSPLAALDQRGNQLLFKALRGQGEFHTVSEWAAAFVAENQPPPPPPPVVSDSLPIRQERIPPPRLDPPPRLGMQKPWLAIELLLVLAAIIGVVWQQHQSPPDPGSDPDARAHSEFAIGPRRHTHSNEARGAVPPRAAALEQCLPAPGTLRESRPSA